MQAQTTPKFPLRWWIVKRILSSMYEFDEQPGRVVAESDLLSMSGHVLISQGLRRFDTVGLSSHGCNQNSDAVWQASICAAASTPYVRMTSSKPG